MSRLLLVRHAQASFSADPTRAFLDYDRLSDLGVKQAEALGEELAGAGVLFDRVHVGPARRHEQTAEGVAAAYARRGLPWPAPAAAPELAEHEGASVVRRALHSPGYEEERRRLEAALAGGETAVAPEVHRAYFSAFQRVTRQWARGELALDVEEESWQDFRARVGCGLRRIMEEAGRGATVAAFTSGGPIGSAVAWTLGLDDERALELAWIVENATVTELLFSGGRVSLKSFNVQPRIAATELVTYV